MDSIARLSELAQRFLVERPKELERPSGFVKRSTARLDGPTFVQMCVVGLDEQRLGQLFPAQSCGGLLGPSGAQSGDRRALWARFQQTHAAGVGRSDGPALARASGGNAAV